MTGFCARALSAFEQLAVDYEAAAHASAEGDEHDIVISLARAEYLFSQSGAVGVVVYLYRNIEILFEFVHDGNVFEGNVVAVTYNAAYGIDRARLTYADTFDIFYRYVARLHRAFDDLADIFAYAVVFVVNVSRYGKSCDYLTVFGDEAAFDTHTSDVNTNVIHDNISLRCDFY